MPLTEYQAELRVAGAGRVALVLDASESAARDQQRVLSLATDLLSALPASVERLLFFLGNPTPYSADLLAARGSQWCAENRNRASLVTPIFERLSRDAGTAVLLIGAGPVYDLEDWQDTPLAQRLLLAAVGESLQDGARVGEEITDPIAQELLYRFHDPITSVRFTGPGFMPLFWNNPDYRVAVTEGAVSLTGERLADFTIGFRCLLEAGGAVQAMAGRASSRETPLALLPVDTAPFPPCPTGQLTPTETAIFRHAAAHEAFTCPSCGKEHGWATLVCYAGASILGDPVYPSLAGQQTGFVLLRTRPDAIWYQVQPFGILRLGGGRVAVKEGQRAVVYAFDEPSSRWQKTAETLPAYHPVGEGTYAILL